MAEIHVATSGPLVKELVAAVLEEFDLWVRLGAAQEAAAREPSNPLRAAESALYDVRTEISEHVQIRLATVLATYGVES